MKRYFIASLCREGVLGGGVIADDEGYTYRTNKLTVSPALRNIRMAYGDILEITKGWLLCFPTVTLRMRDGSSYRLIVFRRKRFCACRTSSLKTTGPDRR